MDHPDRLTASRAAELERSCLARLVRLKDWQRFLIVSSPSPYTCTDDVQPLLAKSSDEEDPVETATTAALEEQECLEDAIVFLERIQKGIYLLGWELGFLVQASTVDSQYVATSFIFNRASQLLLSFLWSYAVALTALVIFFLCQKAIHVYMLDIVGKQSNDNNNDDNNNSSSSNNNNDDNSKYQLLFEEWEVDLKCRFVHGSLWGVLCSWVFLDVLMNFRIRVIYGGILFLVSLLLFLARIWHKQQQQHHQHQQ
jgi:hypothetical protein